MRLTYTDIKQQYLRNIGKAGSVDPNILADFQLNLGQRYQLVLAKMADFVTQGTSTASTVAAQQYYDYPNGTVFVDSVTITVGSFTSPLSPIYSQQAWDTLNAIPLQPTAVPTFIFSTKDDFGIWPIPQDIYTVTFHGFTRDRNMLVDDYKDGAIAVSQGSNILTGSNTAFTSGMIGRWFTITDTSLYGHGQWYRISGFTSATSLTLDQSYQGPDQTNVAYRIGETPEIPEEGHTTLIDGPTADYYGGFKDDQEIAQTFENKFWTGDRTQTNRKIGDSNIAAGLIGMMNRYASRDKKRLIIRQPQPFWPLNKAWGSRII